MSQIGRIGGGVLNDNLLRNGIDLAFKNNLSDTAVLYLDVTNKKIGFNLENPSYDLDINNFFLTVNSIIDQQLKIDNFLIEAPNRITTQLGGISIEPSTPNPVSDFNIFSTDKLSFDSNRLSSLTNENINITAGSNSINLNSFVNIDANLDISQNTTLTGDIDIKGNIQIGNDKPVNIITILPDFTQDILPGENLTYDLGRQDLRWRDLNVVNTEGVDQLSPDSVTVNSQMFIGGLDNINALNTSTPLKILPQTGITSIEDIEINDNVITNKLNTPLTLKSTGIGYYKFAGNNALLIPAGDNNERPLNPEIGDARWNTELDYFEVYNGVKYIPAVGEIDEVTLEGMEEFSYLYSLILG